LQGMVYSSLFPLVADADLDTTDPHHCCDLLGAYLTFAKKSQETCDRHATNNHKYDGTCEESARDLRYLMRVCGQDHTVHHSTAGRTGLTMWSLLRPTADAMGSARRFDAGSPVKSVVEQRAELVKPIDRLASDQRRKRI